MTEPETYDAVDRAYDDPWPAIAAARARCPVGPNPHGFVQVLGAGPAEEVLRHPDVFSNEMGVTMIDRGHRVREHVLAFADPPAHTRQRRLLVKAFSAARVAGMRPDVQAITDDLIDRLPADGGPFEAFSAIARPLPIEVISNMLGVDEDARPEVADWSFQIELAQSLEQPTAEVRQALLGLEAYVRGQVRARRAAAEPPDDLTTAIAQAEVDGDRFDEDEVVEMVMLLIAAGNTTTTNLIANLLAALDANPDEKAKLLADPSLVPAAVEEGLRYDGPLHGLFRGLKAPAEVEGVGLEAGSHVFVCFGAASHDPARFPDPDRFVVDRDWAALPSHFGFGHGIHHCLGSNLARMEAQVALETMLRRLPGLRLAPGFTPRQQVGLIFRSWGQLEMVFDPPATPRSDPPAALT